MRVPTRYIALPWLLSVADALSIWPTIVKQGSVKLLERFGEYKRTLTPGLHWTAPIFESCRTVSLKEIVIDTPPQNCITKDNAPVTVDAVMYYKVFDPVRSCYGVSDLRSAMSNLVLTQVRSEIGKLDLDATFSARQSLSATLLASMKEGSDAWGIQVTRVEIKEIAPNKDILHSMEQVMSAERQKRALVLKSEGERLARVNNAAAQADAAVQAAVAEKKATVLAAEAAAEARTLAADAEARAIVLLGAAEANAARLRSTAARDGLALVAEALGGRPEDALRYEALRQYSEATAKLSASPNAKTLVLPRGDEWLSRLGLALEISRPAGLDLADIESVNKDQGALT